MSLNISDHGGLSILGRKNGDRYRCPICDARRGVSVKTNSDGKLLVHCHANECDVWSLLRSRATPTRVRLNRSDDQDDIFERIDRAWEIWDVARSSTLRPRRYLRERGLEIIPDTLKLLDEHQGYKLTGKRFPVIAAPMKRRDKDGKLRTYAVLLTWLTLDRTAKVAKGNARETWGAPSGTYIPLLTADVDSKLVMGEGIESSLSCAHIARIKSVIAAGSAGNMSKVKDLPACSELILAVDNDANGVGLEKARKAARVFTEAGHKVRIAMPDRPEGEDKWDWNDVICDQDADLDEMRDAILNAPLFEEDGADDKRKIEARLEELAAVDRIEYERQRKGAADELGIRAAVLDKEVAERHELQRVKAGAEFLTPVEPWDKPVDGANLLEELRETFERYVFLPKRAATTASLWVLHTYGLDAADHSPILTLMSPTKRCGKTTVLRLLNMVVPKALPSANVTPATIFRAIERWHPTLLIDEADTFAKEHEELRGILNSGHEQSMAFVLRCVGDDLVPTRFSTWAGKAIALIGRLHPTLEDRSIIITLQRKLPAYKVDRLPKRAGGAFTKLRRKCARWIADNLELLSDAEPEAPKELNDRARDNWDPLLAIADACGGKWPELARAAALKFSAVDDDETLGIMLLQDLQELFAPEKGNWPSKRIAIELAEREDRPWPEFYHGQPITPRGVAKLLAAFQIKPKQVRVGTAGHRANGYSPDQFVSAFKHYLPRKVAKYP
jgi:putative DNA primase/helicase